MKNDETMPDEIWAKATRTDGGLYWTHSKGPTTRYTRADRPDPELAEVRQFQLGDRVTKIKGSKWTGKVVGFYSTELTPIGYAVESETETGSVQIYPEAALAILDRKIGGA